MPREEFPATVKRDLATRAAHFCSNPRCLRLTSGPQVTGSRGTGTGHAAHIRAAAIGGPRYDPGQTPDQRRSIENGIWLCRECGDMVDKDTEGFAPETLHSWRINHEAMIAEIRQKGWSKTIELLRSGPAQPALARRIISIFEDRRVFWASFDVEFPDRVRVSLDNLRHELTKLRSDHWQAAGTLLSINGRSILGFAFVLGCRNRLLPDADIVSADGIVKNHCTHKTVLLKKLLATTVVIPNGTLEYAATDIYRALFSHPKQLPRITFTLPRRNNREMADFKLIPLNALQLHAGTNSVRIGRQIKIVVSRC
jgi:ribosomal protein L37AE/L43A